MCGSAGVLLVCVVGECGWCVLVVCVASVGVYCRKYICS